MHKRFKNQTAARAQLYSKVENHAWLIVAYWWREKRLEKKVFEGLKKPPKDISAVHDRVFSNICGYIIFFKHSESSPT